MDSLKITDGASAAIATHPRVTLKDITDSIAQEHHFTAGSACGALGHPISQPLELLSLCILVMNNGFTIIGKSAPASPENFDAELGKRFAYEDAVRQLWPLMGYALRDKLANS